MAISALPSNALYDVQKYLRQKRATGAQVTPQNERAAWSGFFDTMAQNSLAERASAMQQERLDILRDEQKAAEGAATWSGVGQLVSTVGQGGMLLKGTDIGSKIGLGPTTPATPTPTTPGVSATPSVSTGAAPVTATGTSTVTGAAPTGAAYSTGAAELAGAEAPTAAAVGAETGITAATPYLGPAGVGFASGSVIPGLLGFNKGKGELAAGVAAGAATGAATGAALTSWSGPGAAVGAIIGAVAGGIGAKVK
jgi:hypothetical protein